MSLVDILKRLDQARKVMEAVHNLAQTFDHIWKTLGPSLPRLRIPRLRRGSSEKDDVRKLYGQLVEELKSERVAHQKTREYLRWATTEIENVKKAMRDWQKKAMAKAPSNSRRKRSRK